jgi:hypothetical protein
MPQSIKKSKKLVLALQYPIAVCAIFYIISTKIELNRIPPLYDHHYDLLWPHMTLKKIHSSSKVVC